MTSSLESKIFAICPFLNIVTEKKMASVMENPSKVNLRLVIQFLIAEERMNAACDDHGCSHRAVVEWCNTF